MDNKILLEELNRMNYLFGHKRGVIISEQNVGELTGVKREKISSKPGNWKKNESGPINFAAAEGVGSPIARRIPDPFGESGVKYLLYTEYASVKYFKMKEEPIVKKPDDEKTPPKIIPLPPLSLGDDKFPFPDNQIGPDFKRYPKASEAFNEFINNLINFIDSGCLNNIKEITIQGFADSARPTLINNDHTNFGFSRPYDGLTNDNQRNLFLANNRAKNIMDLIISRVKEGTKDKIDLTNKFKRIDGISYLGQPNRRGGNFRKVDVLPNATQCEQGSLVTNGSSSGGVITVDVPNKKDDESNKTPQLYVDLSPYGPSSVPIQIIENRRFGKVYAISRENMDKFKLDDIIPKYIPSSEFNGKSIVNGSISEGKLTVDGFDFGELGSPPPDYEYNIDYKYMTKSRVVSYTEVDGYVYIRGLSFGLYEYSKLGSNSYPKSNDKT